MTRQDLDSAGLRDRGWRKSLDGALAIITICGTVAWLWAVGGANRQVEATIQLEKFAASLEHTGEIGPRTARDLERMLAQPYYNCARIPCRADVERRNRAVRARLKALIAAKTRPETFAASRGDVTAIGPFQVAEPR